jgi:hypothetical protein
LNELQLNAIPFKDVESFERLEQIRQHLPHELGGAERDAFSFARLKGQSILAESNTRVAEKRVEDFEKTRHFAKFEIYGEQWSLVRVDRQQRLAEWEIEFHKHAISAYRCVFTADCKTPGNFEISATIENAQRWPKKASQTGENKSTDFNQSAWQYLTKSTSIAPS